MERAVVGSSARQDWIYGGKVTYRMRVLRSAGLGALVGVITISLLFGSAVVSAVLPIDIPASASTAGDSEAAVATSRRPNVLFIITDDQSIGSMQVMRKTRKYFKQQGRTFTNAYVTTPSCCPSRASMFTGQYTHNHRVWRNSDGSENLDHETTVQHVLQQNGYYTALFGKYLNAWPLKKTPPKFDEFAMMLGSYSGRPWNFNGKIKEEVNQHSTDLVRYLSRRFIRQRNRIDDKQPWMLAVTPFSPHAPATSTPRHEDSPVPDWKPDPSSNEEDRSDKPDYVEESQAGRATTKDKWRLQLRSLLDADDLVEGVFKTLEETKELGNTIAFFMSDNGRMFGAHGLGGKGVPYTQSVKVPFFMRWPTTVAPKSVDNRLVANIDIAPTIYAALGVDPPTTVDGRNLLDKTWERDRIHTESFGTSARGDLRWGSTITPEYQYSEYMTGPTDDPIDRELYDMVEDPWQLTNLLGDGDPDNDPDPIQMFLYEAQVRNDRKCSGFEPPYPCP